MEKLEIRTFAKINLTLDVLQKREDGYHDIESIMHAIPLYDELEVEVTQGGVTVETDSDDVPAGEGNIVCTAARAFFEHTGQKLGAHIALRKKIPVEAGLAGGSGNAAGVLHALSGMTGANLSREELLEIGARVGADVPFMLTGGAALCSGVGEVVQPITPLGSCAVLIIKPNLRISTRVMFATLNADSIAKRPDHAAVRSALEAGDTMKAAMGMYNVFQPVAAKVHTCIPEICACMMENGAMGAVMSGSGPTVFGIFNYAKTAEYALEACRSKFAREFADKGGAKNSSFFSIVCI